MSQIAPAPPYLHNHRHNLELSNVLTIEEAKTCTLPLSSKACGARAVQEHLYKHVLSNIYSKRGSKL